MTRLTTAPLTGLPFTSLTRNWIVETSDWPAPFIPRILGVADTNCMLPAVTATVRDVALLLPPDVAVIVTEPEALLAVNVVVATPPAVVTVALDKVPEAAELKEKVTEVPSATRLPLLSLIVAVIVEVPFAVMVAGFA